MLHRHKPDELLSQEEHDRLLREGAKVRGTVMHSEVSDTDRSRTRVRIEVRFPDNEMTEVNAELANLYQPAEGSPEAERLTQIRTAQQLRHATRVPKIQLEVFDGSTLPLRYDPDRRTRLVVDEAALQADALRAYIERETKPKAQKVGPAVGPPWTVPTNCPTCGGPVDQATASVDRDPHCEFCHEPLPVSPAAAR
jgi:hypothetical protein